MIISTSRTECVRSFRPDVVTAWRKTMNSPWRFNAGSSPVPRRHRTLRRTHPPPQKHCEYRTGNTGGWASCPERPDQNWHNSLAYNGSPVELDAYHHRPRRRAKPRRQSEPPPVHDGVRVHKDEQITLRLSSAGIAGRRDLAVSDADKRSAVAKRDDRGLIRRGVIDDYQFVGFATARPAACRASRSSSKRSSL
jgi:hypothetical protein